MTIGFWIDLNLCASDELVMYRSKLNAAFKSGFYSESWPALISAALYAAGAN
jgi:hypothetical protein